MLSQNINLLAVLVATIVNQVIGMLWYSPAVFGTRWMTYAKSVKTQEQMKKNMPKAMLTTSIAALVTAYVLAFMIDVTAATTALGGLKTAALIWLGFQAATSIGAYFWDDCTVELYVINNGFYLVSWMIMGAIIGAW